jgi:rsbT co-antagonist protein RsbR
MIKRIDLERVALDALRNRAMDNRGMLPPAQLARFGTTLADLLLEQAGDLEAEAARFVERGLALSSALAVGTALQRALLGAGEQDGALGVAARLAQLAIEISRAETAAVYHQQEQLRAAFTRALDEQRAEIEQQRAEIEQRRAEAERLASLVHELSTPIVPVYDGILVLPLIGTIDERRSREIMERLLDGITQHRADCVIVDITGVAMVDTGVAQHLLQSARAANLLGTTVVLVGIGPEIAQTITQLGVEMGELVTLRDLQAGIMFALGRRRLGIQRVDRH